MLWQRHPPVVVVVRGSRASSNCALKDRVLKIDQRSLLLDSRADIVWKWMTMKRNRGAHRRKQKRSGKDVSAQASVAPRSPRSLRAEMLSLLVVVVFLVSVGLLVRSFGSPDTYILEMMVFLLGCCWELYRLVRDGRRVVSSLLVALAVSMSAFVPGKNESNYSFEDHVNLWPIVFIVAFVVTVLAQYEKEYTVPIGEADTLLHTYALWYLIAAYCQHPMLLRIVCGIVLVPSLFALVHAFSRIPLTGRHRLWLSVWSSVVMLCFGALYVKSMLGLDQFETFRESDNPSGSALYLLHWFLFGMAGAYIAQNVAMVVGYLPGKQRFFNAKYFEEIRALSALHMARFTVTQTSRGAAVVSTLLCSGLFVGNYYGQWVAPSLAVWSSFAFIPPLCVLLAERLSANARSDESTPTR